MAHVHGEKAATQIKSVVDAGTAKMMDSSMGKMGMDSMMKEGMGSMMKMGDGMAQVMKHSKTPGVAKSVATGAVATAGKGVIKKFFTHPLVIFGLGVAAGYYLYKYRKSILSTSDEEPEE
jgi:hypothetical protein